MTMEPQIQVTANFPFEHQIVGVFSEEDGYVQSSASSVQQLVMIIYCVRAIEKVVQNSAMAEEIVTILLTLHTATEEWILRRHSDNLEQSVERIDEYTKKTLERLKMAPVEELLEDNPMELVNLVLSIFGVIKKGVI